MSRLEYVYLIRHIPSGKFYAGSSYSKTCHPSQFWSKYFTSSMSVKALISSDGEDSFEVLEVIPRPLNDARVYEAELLTSVDAMRSDKWLNLTNGRRSYYQYGPRSPEVRAKISNSRIGIKFSDSTRAKISESNRKRKSTPASRSKVAQALTGITRSDDTRMKMAASAKLRPVQRCPHCSKEGVGSGMSRWHFDNCKQKGQ